MFWFQHSQTIVVLYEAHGFSSGAQTFIDTYADGTPEADPNVIAPEGKQQPRRGFGWVWRNYPSVRQRLGWALQPEQGFNTCIAITDAQDAFNNTYFADHTGRLVQLMGTRDSGYYSWSMPAFQNGVAVKVTCNP